MGFFDVVGRLVQWGLMLVGFFFLIGAATGDTGKEPTIATVGIGFMVASLVFAVTLIDDSKQSQYGPHPYPSPYAAQPPHPGYQPHPGQHQQHQPPQYPQQ